MHEASDGVELPEPVRADDSRREAASSFLGRLAIENSGAGNGENAEAPASEVREVPIRESHDGYHAQSLEQWHRDNPGEYVPEGTDQAGERTPFGEPHELVEGVNPHYDAGREDMYSRNCVDVARAVEHRWRGRDEVAAGRVPEHGEYPDQIERWTGAPLQETTQDELQGRLKSAGHGSSAFVVVDYTVDGIRASHAMNAVNKDGTVWSLDGQVGEVAPWPPSRNDSYFSSPGVEVTRVSYVGWDREGRRI